MSIYHRENTGIKTPQGRSCDYFGVSLLGADLKKNKAHAEVYFYEHEEDAARELIPNHVRVIEWDIVEETSIAMGVVKLLSFEDAVTTVGDKVSFSNSTKI